MGFPKRYGQSKVDSCPFCAKTALLKNGQDIPVCKDHQSQNLPELSCLCGEPLELLQGKFGVFFTCINCGNMNFKKALTMNPELALNQPPKAKSESPKEKKEITITSDEIDTYYS